MHIIPGTAVPFVFGQEKVITLAGGPVDVVAADFTGDNVLDLAVSRIGMSDIVVLRNDGTSSSRRSSMCRLARLLMYLITADFNRDNRADLVVSSGWGTISVLFATATGFTGRYLAEH